MRETRKISGIYKITNKVNSRVYIGSSFNITTRWYFHLLDLFCNTHCNKELQDDFNKYDFTSFTYEVVKIVDTEDKLKLLEEEQLIINQYEFEKLYNIYNSLKEYRDSTPKLNEFIDYINDRWLVPDNISDYDLKRYRIWRKEDKDYLVKLAIKCNIFNLCNSKITFNRIIREMETSLGYKIKTGMHKVKGRQLTYKLVVSFDEDRINFTPPCENSDN